MKKLLIGLLVIAVAAPTAWGLISTEAPPPAPEGIAPSHLRALPLLRELQEFNDFGIRLKNRIKAYIYMEERAARINKFKKCHPPIGGGFIALQTTLRKGRIADAMGAVVNTAPGTVRHARLRVHLYDLAGVPLGASDTYAEDLPQGVARPFRASLAGLPLDRVAKAQVRFVPADAPSGEGQAPVYRHPCGGQ
jgi:hypothetical protein